MDLDPDRIGSEFSLVSGSGFRRAKIAQKWGFCLKRLIFSVKGLKLFWSFEVFHRRLRRDSSDIPFFIKFFKFR